MAAALAEIVIVDDESDILAIISDVLRDDGYEPVSFRDGAQAEKYVVEHRPSLVMTDLRLPVVNGRELVLRLRERCGEDLPIIVMSGLADDAIAEHLPVQGYLHKPFELDDLCEMVGRWAARAPSGYLPAHDGCAGASAV